MAFTLRDVKSGFNNTASNQLAAFSTTPSAGDLVVVGVAVFNRSAATIAVSDTYGSAYTRVGAIIDNAGIPGSLAIFCAQNVAGGSPCQVTLTLGSAKGHALVAWLIGAADVAAAANGDLVSATGSVTTPVGPGPTLVTPARSSIFIGLLYYGAQGVVITKPSGWNVIGSNGFTAGMDTASRLNQYTNPYFVRLDTIYKISATTENPSWTTDAGSTTPYLSLQTSFLSSAGGGAGSAGGGYRSRYQCYRAKGAGREGLYVDADRQRAATLGGVGERVA
jgi:hypothetical protein